VKVGVCVYVCWCVCVCVCVCVWEREREKRGQRERDLFILWGPLPEACHLAPNSCVYEFVYMCVYVCVHVHVHLVCVRLYAYSCTSCIWLLRMWLCVCACMYVCVCVCVYTCTRIFMYTPWIHFQRMCDTHMNDSPHARMSHITFEWVMSNEPYLIMILSHITFEWVMTNEPYLNDSCLACMPSVTEDFFFFEWMCRVEHQWVIAHMNRWVMSRV